MRFLFGKGETSIELAGTRMTVDKLRENGYFLADKISNWSAFVRDETPVLLNLAMLLGWADAFVDVGANVGVFSSVLSRIKVFKPGLEIHSFEVDPETRLRLAKNSSPHGFCLHEGASDCPGKAMFRRGSVSHLTNRSDDSSVENAADCFEASLVRLDQLGWNYNNVVIKIDVEGSEYSVLQGASGLFQNNQVLAVYIDSGYGNPKEVEAFLMAHGMRLLNGKTLAESDHWSGVLAVKFEKLKAEFGQT